MNMHELEIKPMLQDYFVRYIVGMRGLSASSAKHYCDALTSISKRLKEKGLVKQDIYEIGDLDRLNYIRNVLYEDEDFVRLNKTGNNMYSCGLNHYLEFSTGKQFREQHNKIVALDIPVAPEASVLIEQNIWKRSGILRVQAIELAGYMCEIDTTHQSFVAATTNKPYMEGHHALPMNLQAEFATSLDVYANIVCLCPVCHRKIHYGRRSDRIPMVKKIFNLRNQRLEKSGIKLSEDDFIDIAIG